MAKISYQDALIKEAADLLAILVSGTNPDGTSFDLSPGGGTAIADTEAPPSTVQRVVTYPELWDSVLGQYARQRAMYGSGNNMYPGYFPGVTLLLYDTKNSVLEAIRLVNVVKHFAVTAITAGVGATIWTPTGGKKFRLMGLSISSSVAGEIKLGDNAVGTIIHRSPTLAAGGIWQLGAADMGNGIISAAANNVLKIDGPTGNVAGAVWGTEE